jgi:hypothetical protein
VDLFCRFLCIFKMVNVQEVLGFELPCHAYYQLLSYDND